MAGGSRGLTLEGPSGTITNAYESNWFERTFDSKGADQRYNAYQAQLQRDWEERMSNTAYQRSVRDLRAAGLNPYLLYGSASPASTPSAAVAHSSGDNSSLFRDASNFISSALRIAAYAMFFGS